MGINEDWARELETLKALYYLTQGLAGKTGRHLDQLAAVWARSTRAERQKWVGLIKTDVEQVRGHFGAIAPDSTYRELQREAMAAPSGRVYINKLRIRRELFSRYEQSLPRWPHIKDHAFIVFDPEMGQANSVFEMDGQLFHDAQFLLQKIRTLSSGKSKQRYLPYSAHRVLHSLMRQTVMALFTFLEAYLNGIAFDCFQEHHDTLSLDDHDFLGEWNTAQKRTGTPIK